MEKIWKAGLIVAGIAFVVAMMQVGTDVHARPQYKKALDAKYPGHAKMIAAKCDVCHFGNSKKNRNDYGMAIGGALSGKNVKDAAQIEAALGKAEGEKSPRDCPGCSTEGKTFGDLIKAGELPGKAP